MIVVVVMVSMVAITIAAMATRGPASPRRVASFAARYRLDLSDSGRDYLTRWLTRSRRWPVLGAVAVAVAAAMYGATVGQVRLYADLLICGWLAGLVATEIDLGAPQRRPRTARRMVVASRLSAQLFVLASLCLAVAVTLIAAEGDVPGVRRWTVASLVVLAVAAWLRWRVAHRPGPADVELMAVDEAIRRVTAAAGTAAGAVVTVLFLVRAADAAAAATSQGVLAAAHAGLDTVGLLGAVMIGVTIALTGAPTEPPPDIRRPSLPVAAAGAVVVVAAAACLTWGWVHTRPPFPATALAAAATLHAVSDAEAQDFIGPGVNVPLIGDSGRLIAGTVTWRRPPSRSGYLNVYLIDSRSHLKPSYVETVNTATSMGGNSWDHAVEAKYRWLKGAGPIPVDGGWTEAGCDLTTPTVAGATTINFIAVFPNADPDDPNTGLYATAPVDVSDLMVALVYTGDDDQIYWAQRLLG